METITAVKLSAINIDQLLQPRTEGIDPDHVRELESVAENWPPLAVVPQGDGYLLVDGFHRFAAAQNLGLDQVPVTVLDIPEDSDLHALAFGLNAVHGRPLTLSDRRNFAMRLLRSHPEWSDREIGRRSGITQPPVAKLRADLESRQEIAATESRIGGDGQVYRVAPSVPKRAAGELPEPVPEALLGKLFTSEERRAQRKLAQYFDRLAVALDDGYAFENWQEAKHAADACRAVFDANQVAELAQRLGDACHNVLDVALALGYEPIANEF